MLSGLDIGMPLEGGKSGNQKKKIKKVLKASQIQGGTDPKEKRLTETKVKKEKS